jgi:hypothetical protein
MFLTAEAQRQIVTRRQLPFLIKETRIFKLE